MLSDIFATQDRPEWCRRLEAEDVPHAPMYDTSEALNDPQAQHLGILVEGRHEQMGAFQTVRTPLTFNGQREQSVVPPPVLGEHNAQIVAPLRERLAQKPGGL